MSDAEMESAEQRRARKAAKRQRRREQEEAAAANSAGADASAASSEAAAARPAKRARTAAATEESDDEQVAPEAPAASDGDASVSDRDARRAAKAAKKARKEARAQHRAEKAARRARREEKRAARERRRAARAAAGSDDEEEEEDNEDDNEKQTNAADAESELPEYVDSSSESEAEATGTEAAAAATFSDDGDEPDPAVGRLNALFAPLRTVPRDMVPDDPTVESVHYRKGKALFTAREKRRLHEAIDKLMQTHGISNAEWVQICTPNAEKPAASSAYWTELAAVLPLRSKVAVKDYCVRKFCDRKTGKWSEEDVQLLKELVELYGENAWAPISKELGRTRMDCRDKWRLCRDPDFGAGQWSAEEDATLTFWVMKQSAISKCTDELDRARREGDAVRAQHKSDHLQALMSLKPTESSLLPEDTPLPTREILWTTISSLVGRAHSACRGHWYTVLAPRLTLGGARLLMQGLRWNRDEEALLVRAIWAQGAEHIDEIDWTRCTTETWPIAHSAREHFMQLFSMLTSVERYRPLARPDAPLDTILNKMLKHLSPPPRGDPMIFRMRTSTSNRFRGAGPRRSKGYSRLNKSAIRIMHSMGRDDEPGLGADDDAFDAAEAAAAEEDQARLERQRLREEAASAALAQARQAELDKAAAREARARQAAEAKQRHEAMMRRMEEEEREKEEATVRAAERKKLALQAQLEADAKAAAAKALGANTAKKSKKKKAAAAAAAAAAAVSSPLSSDEDVFAAPVAPPKRAKPAATTATAPSKPQPRTPAAVARPAAPPARARSSSSSETSEDDEQRTAAPAQKAAPKAAATTAATSDGSSSETSEDDARNAAKRPPPPKPAAQPTVAVAATPSKARVATTAALSAGAAHRGNIKSRPPLGKRPVAPPAAMNF